MLFNLSLRSRQPWGEDSMSKEAGMERWDYAAWTDGESFFFYFKKNFV